MDGSTNLLCPLSTVGENTRFSLPGPYFQLDYRFISSAGQGDLVISIPLLGVSGKGLHPQLKRPFSAFEYVV